MPKNAISPLSSLFFALGGPIPQTRQNIQMIIPDSLLNSIQQKSNLNHPWITANIAQAISLG